MNKETILREYEETIQKVSELSMLLANFDSNTEFSRRSYEFLWLLKENFCQNVKILETIALRMRESMRFMIFRENTSVI